MLQVLMQMHSGKELAYVCPLNLTNSDSVLKTIHFSSTLYHFWIWSSYC